MFIRYADFAAPFAALRFWRSAQCRANELKFLAAAFERPRRVDLGSMLPINRDVVLPLLVVNIVGYELLWLHSKYRVCYRAGGCRGAWICSVCARFEHALPVLLRDAWELATQFVDCDMWKARR